MFNSQCTLSSLFRLVLTEFWGHRAIISDITTPANRSKALAHVGIAFAICFIIGPPIGAYFASRPLPPAFAPGGLELNIYAAPALLTLVLLSVETIFLMVALPETRGKSIQGSHKKTNGHSNGHANGSSNGAADVHPDEQSRKTKNDTDIAKRLALLKTLRVTHFLFLGLFSGVEFTLTFLTFDCEHHFHPSSLKHNFLNSPFSL